MICQRHPIEASAQLTQPLESTASSCVDVNPLLRFCCGLTLTPLLGYPTAGVCLFATDRRPSRASLSVQPQASLAETQTFWATQYGPRRWRWTVPARRRLRRCRRSSSCSQSRTSRDPWSCRSLSRTPPRSICASKYMDNSHPESKTSHHGSFLRWSVG